MIQEIKDSYHKLHREEIIAMKEIESILGVPIPQYKFIYEDGFGFPMFPFGYIEENGHIIKLGLSEQKLTSIPESLKKLTKLTTLKINSNFIREIPRWFEEFHHLKTINFGQNQIQNIDADGRWWTHIRALNFEENHLTEIPLGLKSSKELVVATFANNELTTIPEWFGTLTALKVLSFRKNYINTIPNSIKNLKELSQLVLAFNNITSIPDVLGSFSFLHVLDLSHNNISRLPDTFQNLHRLEQLHMENNQFYTLPWIIGRLPRIQQIFLSNNPWTGKSREITEQIAYEIPKGHWIALDYLRNEYSKWNPEILLEKIRENQTLDELDYLHPQFKHYLPLFEENCKKIENKAAKFLSTIISEIEEEQLSDTKILL